MRALTPEEYRLLSAMAGPVVRMGEETVPTATELCRLGLAAAIAPTLPGCDYAFVITERGLLALRVQRRACVPMGFA